MVSVHTAAPEVFIDSKYVYGVTPVADGFANDV
jgi:hypothetical protein